MLRAAPKDPERAKQRIPRAAKDAKVDYMTGTVYHSVIFERGGV